MAIALRPEDSDRAHKFKADHMLRYKTSVSARYYHGCQTRLLGVDLAAMALDFGATYIPNMASRHTALTLSFRIDLLESYKMS